RGEHAQSQEYMSKVQLQCHFTWPQPLHPVLRQGPGQNYNLQGFLQQTLGHSSEALSLLHSASEALRGPELLVNYSDLAWVYYKRDEHVQCQEYLSKVEALRREYPTEGDQLHPEVLVEKAFSLMEFYNDKKLLAAELLEKALKQQPTRWEWLSAQAMALVSAHRHKEYMDEKVLLTIRQAIERDPDNLELQAEYLNLRVQREENGRRRVEVAALSSQLLKSPHRLLRDIKSVLEVQRRAVCEAAAVELAESALHKRPDSRYLKACLATCLKWQVDQQREQVSQELIERTAALLGEVVSLYPDSCLKTELDQANVYARSDHSLAQAARLYQDLLRRDLEPVPKQMVLNQYAKFLKHDQHDYAMSMEYHMRAAEIPVPSFYRSNSIATLRRLNPRDRRLRRQLNDFLERHEDS
uniref:Uncharacterized protein n=1 Tax=Periophthalmus magnuspinnatus TaxID=409849 RepID=A0A3B4BD67_9GOBI